LEKMDSSNFIDYSNETETLTIKDLLDSGFSPYESAAYLSKMKIQKFFENDNGGKNEDFKRERGIDQLPLPRSKTKKKERTSG